MVIVDRYLLTQSKEFSLGPTEEVRIDLKLKRKPCQPETKITGRVTDKNVPVIDATVKVLDQQYNPVTHAVTNEEGVYLIENLKPGEYKLTATAQGFLVANLIGFSLRVKETKTINIEIKEDKVAQETNFVYGKVMECTGKIIRDATVKLFSSDMDCLIAETTSNEFGQYLFYGIPPGEYFGVASKSGFLPSEYIRFVVSQGQFLKINFYLRIDTQTSDGTVSGVITDGLGQALAGVCVGLFRIDLQGETLLQIKTTNSDGLYLFTDLQSGEYVVKAKMQEKWEVAQTLRLP